MDNINLSGPSQVTKKPVVGSENSNSIEESKTTDAKVNPLERENTVETVPDRVIQVHFRDDPDIQFLQTGASIPEEEADDPGDLYEEDGEDMVIVHMMRDRHGRLVKIDSRPMSTYEKIRERAIGKQQHFKTVI